MYSTCEVKQIKKFKLYVYVGSTCWNFCDRIINFF